MTTYFVGGEMDTLTPLDNFGIAENGTISESGLSRGSIYMTTTGVRAAAYLINPTTGVRAGATGTIWSHCRYLFSDASSNDSNNPGIWWYLYNSAGNKIIRFISDGTTGRDANGNLNGSYGWTKCQYSLDGTTWTDVAISFAIPQGSILVFDLKLTIGTTGEITVYLNQTIVASITGIDTSSMTDVALEIFSDARGTNFFNSVIIASYSTVGHTIRVRPPGANGAEAGWNGSASGINEFPLNDGDSISTASAGITSTFNGNNYAATASGKVIKAVAVGARVRASDSPTGPQNLSGVLRINGTDYVAPHMGGVGPSITGTLSIWDTDPSTGNPWVDVTNVNGEFGVKSDT